MTLQVASAAVRFPLALPASGQRSSAKGRAAIARLRDAQRQMPRGAPRLAEARSPALARLRAAEHDLPSSRVEVARAGADLLIAAGLLGAGEAAVLAGIGRRVNAVSGYEEEALHAAVTLAASTVLSQPARRVAERVAREWLSLLGIMDRRGTLRRAIKVRGIR